MKNIANLIIENFAQASPTKTTQINSAKIEIHYTTSKKS